MQEVAPRSGRFGVGWHWNIYVHAYILYVCVCARAYVEVKVSEAGLILDHLLVLITSHAEAP